MRIGRMRELLDRSLSGDVHVQVQFAPDLWPVEVDPGSYRSLFMSSAEGFYRSLPEG